MLAFIIFIQIPGPKIVDVCSLYEKWQMKPQAVNTKW